MRVASGRGVTSALGEAEQAAAVEGVAEREDNLLRRAPGGYLWNQAYSLWLFGSLFLHQWVITKILSKADRGVFEFIKSPAVLATTLASLGLDAAGSVYLPRALAEGGRTRAATVAVRLLAIRLAAIIITVAAMLWGLPALANLPTDVLTTLGLPEHFSEGLNDPAFHAHLLTMAGYVVSAGMSALLGALLTALLRTRPVFIVGSIAQALTVALAYLLVQPLGGGVDGALAALALPQAFAAIIYLVVLFRILGTRIAPLAMAGERRPTARMLLLGMAAWLADVANTSMKVVALGLLAYFAISNAEVGGFGIAFEMGHAATFLFVAGLGGVGLAVMAAAFANRDMGHLGIAWRTVCKIQVLLGVPLLAFCVPHADAIIERLYPGKYPGVGPLLALFLALNALTRLSGGGAHEAALYVLGRWTWVIISRWGAIVALAIGGYFLIRPYGVAGGLIAVGLAQMVTELVQLALARIALKRTFPLAFTARVLLALVPGVVFSYLWRPESWGGLILAGLAYAAIFIVSLYVIRPLDAEDGALLAQVTSPLRTLLMPFVSRARPA